MGGEASVSPCDKVHRVSGELLSCSGWTGGRCWDTRHPPHRCYDSTSLCRGIAVSEPPSSRVQQAAYACQCTTAVLARPRWGATASEKTAEGKGRVTAIAVREARKSIAFQQMRAAENPVSHSGTRASRETGCLLEEPEPWSVGQGKTRRAAAMLCSRVAV